MYSSLYTTTSSMVNTTVSMVEPVHVHMTLTHRVLIKTINEFGFERISLLTACCSGCIFQHHGEWQADIEKQSSALLNILFTQALLIEADIGFQEIMEKHKPTLLRTYTFTYTLGCQFHWYTMLKRIQLQ